MEIEGLISEPHPPYPQNPCDFLRHANNLFYISNGLKLKKRPSSQGYSSLFYNETWHVNSAPWLMQAHYRFTKSTPENLQQSIFKSLCAEFEMPICNIGVVAAI